MMTIGVITINSIALMICVFSLETTMALHPVLLYVHNSLGDTEELIAAAMQTSSFFIGPRLQQLEIIRSLSLANPFAEW